MTIAPKRSTNHERGASSTPDLFRWPHDYLPRDDGRMMVRRDYVAIFDELGWNTVADVMAHRNRHVMRRLAQRENCRLELPDPTGAGVVRAYLKLHFGSHFGEWLQCRLSGLHWLPPGLAEAAAVGQCQRAGVPTLSVIAAGQGIGARPWNAPSFFLSEEIPEGIPADDFWLSRFVASDDNGRDEQPRRQVLQAIAATSAALHRGRLFHRDFYWCHFFIREPLPGEYVAHLIDLQRVSRSRMLAWRWRIKDLAQFLFSIPKGTVSNDELDQWFRDYCGSSEPGLPDRLLFAAVKLRAFFYWWKDG